MELLALCYTEYHLELGEISSYPPGYKENGSVFCHNNPWVVCGEAVLAMVACGAYPTRPPARPWRLCILYS